MIDPIPPHPPHIYMFTLDPSLLALSLSHSLYSLVEHRTRMRGLLPCQESRKNKERKWGFSEVSTEMASAAAPNLFSIRHQPLCIWTLFLH